MPWAECPRPCHCSRGVGVTQGIQWVRAAQDAAMPSRWHPSRLPGRGQWLGGPGSRSESTGGEGPQAERKLGDGLGASNVFPPTQARGAWQPLQGLESALTSLLCPYFRPYKSADTAEAMGLLPGGLDMGFGFQVLFSPSRKFSLKEIKHNNAGCCGGWLGANKIINTMLNPYCIFMR